MRNECTRGTLSERVNRPLKPETFSTDLPNPFSHSVTYWTPTVYQPCCRPWGYSRSQAAALPELTCYGGRN